MLAKLRIRHLLPATYLLIALVSGAFALLGWYVSEQVRRSVDELVTRDIAVQQAAADLSDAVGTVSTSLAGVMTRVRSPMGGFSETTVAFNIIETRVAVLRELIGARPGAAPHALLDDLDRHVAGAVAVKDGVRAALADPDVDLYGALRRWTEAVEPIEATLRELRAIFAANMTAGKLAAERWSQLGYWIAAIALVASVGVGAGGTVFVIRHVAQPLDWGTRILRKLASGRRDLEIAIPDRHDEIGDLFAAFASYQDSLREGERLSAEAAEQRQRLDTALNNMSHGLAMFDAAGGLILCNAVYARMYALPPELAVPGTALERIVAHRVEQGCGPVDADDFQRRHVTRAVAGKASQYTLDLQDGRVVRVAHQPMEGGGWVAMHEDITEAVRAEARISHMARHDALTDLPNRVQFRDRLAEGLRRLPRDEAIAVHCLDLDRFKSVNDSLGHPVGDALLGQVAERLKDCVAPGDTVARLGGDEFAIVQVGLLQPTGATALAQRVVDALAAPFDVLGHQIVMGTSVGIAVAPHDGADPDHLLKNADLALYRAKAEAKGSYRFFESDMDAAMQTRRALEVDLRLGLARGEFALHYQPLVNLRSGRVSGCEALVRWHHPERGLVSPAEFIPLAEEIGLIVPLGEWILRQACLDAAGWPEPITVAVNLSPVQFRGRSLVAGVFAALSASHLPASRLELEITEAVMLDDTETTLATLHQLRALGVRIAMDDFGTGYSSLSYLRRFPFDKIKIDRSFVRDLPERSDSVAIVRAVTGLGQSLGIHTTAEGVETPEQLAALQREGCDEVQGFLFSKPVPGADFVKLLARGDFARVA